MTTSHTQATPPGLLLLQPAVSVQISSRKRGFSLRQAEQRVYVCRHASSRAHGCMVETKYRDLRGGWRVVFPSFLYPLPCLSNPHHLFILFILLYSSPSSSHPLMVPPPVLPFFPHSSLTQKEPIFPLLATRTTPSPASDASKSDHDDRLNLHYSNFLHWPVWVPASSNNLLLLGLCGKGKG